MRPGFLLAVPLLLCSSLPAAGQTSAAAQQDTPETVKAAYDQAMQAKDWQAALADAQKLVVLKPTAENLRLLANAQLNSGANADALGTTDRALDAVEKEKPAEGQPDTAWKDEQSKIYLTRGNAYLKLRRNSEAIDAYNQAAQLAADPGIPTFNICATYYNVGDMQNAESACRRAAAVNPANPNAWFVLGSLLFANAKLDAQGKFTVTAECRQALQKYIELAPDGPHAADTKAMLGMIAK